ncbi:WhiB family transcriptional regulator [Amycolatopsis thailandensis]|uniref:WhiB family transcriptional regulator n=1 Tax=Amycolatopsis thailandensis TaxID=589330 RepID=UPI003664896A
MADWRHDAECRGEDPELFFPVGTGESAVRQERRAKAVCARCPVAGDCLAWALASGQDAGVWGGLAEEERRTIRRSRVRNR